ncbi:hypothetical protein [Aquibacillus saliphilus]|uniref:hypothetical protein n=1 Tax=Aquibacillus saliphilus TaxID=1909422 RepID=UPI001CF0BC5C|nr:hypothetical protein [Aquibacillus saliphilus]
MFVPLTGINHTKVYIKDKAYREQYKRYKQSTITNTYNQYKEYQLFSIQRTDTNTYYIISTSLHDPTKLQYTCFINNKPYSHMLYDDLLTLINNEWYEFSQSNLKECI